MGTPLMTRLSIMVRPVGAAPETCDARVKTKSAEMVVPDTFSVRLARETTESTSSDQLIVPAESTSPLNTDGMLPVSMDASRASFGPARDPVPESTVLVHETFAPTPFPCPLTLLLPLVVD